MCYKYGHQYQQAPPCVLSTLFVDMSVCSCMLSDAYVAPLAGAFGVMCSLSHSVDTLPIDVRGKKHVGTLKPA